MLIGDGGLGIEGCGGVEADYRFVLVANGNGRSR